MTPLSDVAIDDPTTRSVPSPGCWRTTGTGSRHHPGRRSRTGTSWSPSWHGAGRAAAAGVAHRGEPAGAVVAISLPSPVAPVLWPPPTVPLASRLWWRRTTRVMVGDAGGRWQVRERRGETIISCDLALLPTSGSTGSASGPALPDQRQANAEAIATYLSIRRMTRRPACVHYCYGLSVINSHLLRGASLLLTDRSIDSLLAVHRGTARPVSRVYRTFDLLDGSASRPYDCRGCGTSHRPVAGWRRAGRRTPSWAGAAAGPVRDVRADRGHCPDGLPPDLALSIGCIRCRSPAGHSGSAAARLARAGHR